MRSKLFRRPYWIIELGAVAGQLDGQMDAPPRNEIIKKTLTEVVRRLEENRKALEIPNIYKNIAMNALAHN